MGGQRRDEDGQTAAEYLGVLAFIAVLVAALAGPAGPRGAITGVGAWGCRLVGACTPDEDVVAPVGLVTAARAPRPPAVADELPAGIGDAPAVPSPDELVAMLTGDLAPRPAFVTEHYAPVLIETQYGMRYGDPFGACSSPFGDTGGSFDFGDECDVQDYGYDLLRWFGVGGEHREVVDDLFAADVDVDCDTRTWNRPFCELWAELYGAAVALGTRLDGGPPSGPISRA